MIPGNPNAILNLLILLARSSFVACRNLGICRQFGSQMTGIRHDLKNFGKAGRLGRFETEAIDAKLLDLGLKRLPGHS
jgi:hypothetical protein